MTPERTQVGIVGAGPAGLLLSHLLAREGIESVILEDRDRDYVEERIRAGVLEQGTVDMLDELGLSERLHAEGMVHDGIEIRFNGEAHRIDFPVLTGKRITVYGQHEVVKDLIAARLAAGGLIHFGVGDVRVHAIASDRPRIGYTRDGKRRRLDCDFIAGCDGSHGICRSSFPAGALTLYERVYPFAWLGILTESAPPTHEVTYTHHERGFALLSMRSLTVARLYLQCAPDEDVANWPDERIWEELDRRTALAAAGSFAIERGPVTQKGVTAMRSLVAEPMQHGRLFLAGDAAHIVPPTGAKGMNLAAADVRHLAEGLSVFYRDGDSRLLDAYSARCLRRVWKAQRFSWWMTTMLHINPADSAFDRRRQIAELDYVTSSHAAMTALAENYVGLPFDAP
jgi:p-hydroxybenzoate 3-monooxygenase